MRADLNGYTIDHVLFGGNTLSGLETAFERAGVSTEFGGEHGHGLTHNAVRCFSDGSYLELIAPTSPDAPAPRRDVMLRGNAGPCGWALETDDIEVATGTLRSAGVPVADPFELSRDGPDGTTSRWKLTWLGEGVPGAYYPLLIEDSTPRSYRITDTAATAASPLTGITSVLLGVEDADIAFDDFDRAFGPLPEPVRDDANGLSGAIDSVPGTPLGLLSETDNGPLSERIQRFGEIPRAFLIGTTEFDRCLETFAIASTERVFGDRIAWVDIPAAPPASVGLVETVE